ncbi:PFU domain-containing protein, partial [Helicosporidium sp. ATCC 50920]
SDRAARLFSRDATRKLPQEAQQALAAQVASRRGQSGEAAEQEGAETGLPPGVKLEDASALTRPGSRPGQIVVVREGGGAVAYSWDAGQSTWERVGEVVSGPGEASVARPRHGGREWDYVFDVDIDDSAPRLKLAIDRADNPYDAADRFLQENALPDSYRDQVVQFILRNVQDLGVAEGGGSGMVDPYTGASAYQPSSSRPSGLDTQTRQSATGGGADPYTGARAAGTGSLTQQSGVPCTFEALPAAEGMLRKLRELDAQAEARLSSEELEGVEALLRAQC